MRILNEEETRNISGAEFAFIDSTIDPKTHDDSWLESFFSNWIKQNGRPWLTWNPGS